MDALAVAIGHHFWETDGDDKAAERCGTDAANAVRRHFDRYEDARIDQLTAERDALQAENERLRGQLSRLMEAAYSVHMERSDEQIEELHRVFTEIQQENSDENHD